jgi:deoxyribonuclease IV
VEAILGLENVPVIHANDSKAPLASHVDRHEHIGRGYIGLEGFQRLLTHPKLRSKAFILETPVDADGDEQKNLDTLKAMYRTVSMAAAAATASAGAGAGPRKPRKK